MADNRKYYYLKLKEGFFESEEIKILESMKDGYMYSNILLKLYLKSLRNEGRLMYRNVIPYTPEILATLVGHQVGTVEKALEIFQKLELIEVLDNGAIYMMDIQNHIGKSSTEADRQREYYNRVKNEKILLGESGKNIPALPETQDTKPKSRKTISNYPTDFEAFWSVYPRKVGKGEAYKKYKARLKDGWSEAELLEAAKNYADRVARERTEQKYIKHAKTFLSENTPFTDFLPKGSNIEQQALINDVDAPYEEWRD